MHLTAIKTKALAGFIVLLMAFFVGSFVLADTDYLKSANNGLDDSAKGLFNTSATLESTLGSIISVALSMLGVLFLGLMVYGGFLWMTARGDEGQVTKAKDLFTAATVGLVIVLGAYAISIFVVTKFSEKTLQQSSHNTTAPTP